MQFAKSEVWLMLWVDGAFMEYVADDLRVRVLPNESKWAEPPKERRLSDLTSSKPGPTERFRKRDLNGDGRITKDEFPPENRIKMEKVEKRSFEEMFSGWDQDKSGYLDPSEFR